MERVVICPYCNRTMAAPTQVGFSYDCDCGALFAIYPEDDMGDGLARLVTDLFQETNLIGGELSDLLAGCHVTIYEDYDPDENPVPGGGLSELIHRVSFSPQPDNNVNLVWVARDEGDQMENPFVQIEN